MPPAARRMLNRGDRGAQGSGRRRYLGVVANAAFDASTPRHCLFSKFVFYPGIGGWLLYFPVLHFLLFVATMRCTVHDMHADLLAAFFFGAAKV